MIKAFNLSFQCISHNDKNNIPYPSIDDRLDAFQKGDRALFGTDEHGEGGQEARQGEEYLQPKRGVEHCLPEELVVHL